MLFYRRPFFFFIIFCFVVSLSGLINSKQWLTVGREYALMSSACNRSSVPPPRINHQPTKISGPYSYRFDYIPVPYTHEDYYCHAILRLPLVCCCIFPTSCSFWCPHLYEVQCCHDGRKSQRYDYDETSVDTVSIFHKIYLISVVAVI